METHVIEFAPMLMAEQLDQMGGEQLRRKIESMGVKVHTSKNTKEIVQQGTEARKTMHFADGSELHGRFHRLLNRDPPRAISWPPSAGWRSPSAAASWSTIACQTSDPDIYAIGECASWNNRVYGLVAPAIKWPRWPSTISSAVKIVSPAPTLSAKLEAVGVDVGGIERCPRPHAGRP